MKGDLLQFSNDKPDIELEPELAIELEPMPTADATDVALEPDAASAPLALLSAGLVEILPADFPLPRLAKFVPNRALRAAADEATTYARAVAVEGAEGLQRADVALAALRGTLKAIRDHFEEPTRIANELHKRLTGIRSEWTEDGDAAVKTVGDRIFTEQRRLEQLAADERRRAQDEANRLAREQAAREAETAAHNNAPPVVVEELRRQAETATAPPVAAPTPAPLMRSSTTVTTWKARVAGTPAHDDPNPGIEMLTTEQREKVLELLRAIVAGQAPIAAIEINWSYLNKRAKADKSTLAIAGVEAFEEGGVRAKGTRAR